ncbi:MAG TPA: DUF2628 domain-containing protein [Roseococcus sp.]|jgi:hypothetical protein|nr:DUF2628 domain-containing protein [Roseococcus sp.]
MRAWTVHLAPDARRPVLLREGFSLWAFVFGAFWLLAHRCWIAGLAALALALVLGWLFAPWGPIALNLLLGFHGRDIRRWTLERRGWRLAHVVLAEDEDAALVRLLGREPGLTARFA